MKHFFQVFENLVSAIALKVTEMFCICKYASQLKELLCCSFQQEANDVLDQMNSCDGSGNVKKDNGDEGGSDSNGVNSSRCIIVRKIDQHLDALCIILLPISYNLDCAANV